ncbi:bromodomain and WD repeat-containing protein 1 isoform X1 [Cucumis melo var. makuwa]|uniref:Bromodomain and WD repeat-containing protein 1 isoform X1 n=1 Tax=Cucumis melo var. makuwa TaxID=1194695 RepID=A0A5D3CWD9_CUCMM|nr:bromodomain and WD repeat-containing protein 1 isoform X1 [Cucumis melo var. makuwa]
MTNMALRKFVCGSTPSINLKHSSFPIKLHEQTQFEEPETNQTLEPDVEIDPRELLPRRYHAWYSRSGVHSGHENDDGLSFPLSYQHLVERYPHVDKNHLIKLLKQLILNKAPPSRGMSGGIAPNAADVPTLLGTGTFSLLSYDKHEGVGKPSGPPAHMRWPHMKADSVRGLSLREIGGGFSRHQRAPSVRAACYAIAKPSTMVQKMQNIKRLRGHRNAVYCASVKCLLSSRSHVADSECQKSAMAASLLRVGANKDGNISIESTIADLKDGVAVNSTFKVIEDPLMIGWMRSWVVGQSELIHS